MYSSHLSFTGQACLDQRSPRLVLVKACSFLKLYFTVFVDIDECAKNVNRCDLYAKCINTEGSHKCECRTGFTGNGHMCKGTFSFTFILHLCRDCNSFYYMASSAGGQDKANSVF